MNAGHFVAGLQGRCECSVDQAVQVPVPPLTISVVVIPDL